MVVNVEVESAPQEPISWIKRCFQALLSVVVAVVVVECFLRCIDLPLVAPGDFVAGKDANRSFEFDFQTMWRFPHDPLAKWGPSAADEFGNRFGCRGYEPAAKKTDADLRIICVGASGVSGFAMPFGWSFGILFERQLQRQFPGARVETVLAGVAGFSSEQQRALLQEKMDDFQPDLVIFLAETHNDIEDAGERNDQDNLDRLRPGFSRTWDLLRFKYKFITDLSNFSHRTEGLPDSKFKTSRVPLSRFVENFSTMLSWVKASGGESLVVVPKAGEGVLDQGEYRSAVVAIVGDLKIASVDLATVASHPSDWLDPAHLSMRGHQNLSKALQRVVAKKQLLLGCKERLSRSSPTFTITKVEPNEITIGKRQKISLHLSGLNRDDLCRVWCGGLLASHSWQQDGILQLILPRLLPARLSSIELITTGGSLIFEDVLRVHPPKLVADLMPDGSMTLKVDLPEVVEIAFIATVMPQKVAAAAEFGSLIRARGQTWPPPVDQAAAFYQDHVLLHGASTRKGLWSTTWKGGPSLPSGTSIAIQGLLGIPSPGDFVPISLTTPVFLTVP